MILQTKRLILRPWNESDAADLFEYAKDENVGPIAGWTSHKNVQESLEVIKNIFCGKECYAVCLKENNRAIGAVELKLNGNTDMTTRDDECEIGYWIGKPFWGNGYIPEAVKELLHRAFEDLKMTTVWCGYYEGNEKSKRVQQKCGFEFFAKIDKDPVPLMNEIRTTFMNRITKEMWKKAE